MLSALLLCEEEATVRIVTRVFKDLGVDVEICLDEKTALRKLNAKKFDALIADDEINGAPLLLETARDLPECRKTIRIILVGQPTSVGAAFEQGTQIVLYKPLSIERVRHGLRAVRNLMAQERRGGYKRVPVEIQAKLSYGKFVNRTTTVEDLSDSGAALRCENPLPASARLGFECILPNSEQPIKAKAEVVWQDTRGGVGIRFLDMPAQSRKRLVDWLTLESLTLESEAASTVEIDISPVGIAVKAGS